MAQHNHNQERPMYGYPSFSQMHPYARPSHFPVQDKDRLLQRSDMGIPAEIPPCCTLVATKVLWLLDLPSNCDEDEIAKCISHFGPIVSIDFNRFKNYGFIKMASRADCYTAIISYGRNLFIRGKKIKVCYAKSPGMNNKAYDRLWDGKRGVMNVPWSAITPNLIEQLYDGAYLDEKTLPGNLYHQHDNISDVPFVEVHSPVYSRWRAETMNSDISFQEVHSPVFARSIDETMTNNTSFQEVNSPVYSHDATRDTDLMPGNRRMDRPRPRNLFRTGAERSRSISRSTAIENLPHRPPIADRVTIPSKRRRSRSVVPDSPPPALREVDSNVFEVTPHEVKYRPSAIMDVRLATNAARGRGNAMAFTWRVANLVGDSP